MTKTEVQETIRSYITNTGKYVKTHERGARMKETASLESNSSAQSDALNKEDMPKKKQVPEMQDVFMNVNDTKVHPIRGALETSEDDTLMGRLAKRMASRDYIDSMNLGMGTKSQRAGKATLADNSDTFQDMSDDEFRDSVPRRLHITGEALAKDAKMEEEHKGTLKKVASGKLTPDEALPEIAKDHIKELGPEYYEELDEMESKLKKKKVNESQDEGYGLHLQTLDKKASNMSSPLNSTNDKVIEGNNMAAQARTRGNVFDSKDTD